MSGWNYRVAKHETEHGPVFDIREVYYYDDGSILGWTAQAVGPYGEDIVEVQRDMLHFNEAFSKPVLDLDLEIKNLEARKKADEKAAEKSGEKSG